MMAKHCWWIVSIICTRTHDVIKSGIDAVFAGSADEAMELAGSRNPRKPGETFGLQECRKSKTAMAIRLSDKRTEEIADLTELCSRL